jgi:hypothetical protein
VTPGSSWLHFSSVRSAERSSLTQLPALGRVCCGHWWSAVHRGGSNRFACALGLWLVPVTIAVPRGSPARAHAARAPALWTDRLVWVATNPNSRLHPTAAGELRAAAGEPVSLAGHGKGASEGSGRNTVSEPGAWAWRGLLSLCSRSFRFSPGLPQSRQQC